MLKRLLSVLTVCSILVVGSVTLASVRPADCYLYNVGNVQLNGYTSVKQAYPVLGRILSFEPGVPSGAYIPMHAICENGSIWLDGISGNETPDTYARIVRVIWTKPDVCSAAGAKIGDSIVVPTSLYGLPDDIKHNNLSEYDGIVDDWLIYFPINGRLEHMDFGVKDGVVRAIVVSSCPGGL